MFEKLQRKWKVNGVDLLLIITTFAIGGSLCGYVARKIISLLELEKGVLWVTLYIIILTIIWPLCVLLTSIPFGQYKFFKKYILKIFKRFGGNAGSEQMVAETNMNESNNQHSTAEIIPFKSSQMVNLAIFASGAGSNAQKIIEHFKHNSHINISLIVCNKPQAGVLEIAKNNNIEILLIEKDRFFNGDGYVEILQKHNIDKIILAGFLWKIPSSIIKVWPAAIINIHPALLPKYGGKGMYGQHVHEAVIANKETESGITIHYVDEIYDHGAILLQVPCPVTATDTAETLAQKIHVLEHRHFPVAIEHLINAKTSLNKQAFHQS